MTPTELEIARQVLARLHAVALAVETAHNEMGQLLQAADASLEELRTLVWRASAGPRAPQP